MEIIANIDRLIYKKVDTSQLPYSLPLYFKQFIAFYAFVYKWFPHSILLRVDVMVVAVNNNLMKVELSCLFQYRNTKVENGVRMDI